MFNFNQKCQNVSPHQRRQEYNASLPIQTVRQYYRKTFPKLTVLYCSSSLILLERLSLSRRDVLRECGTVIERFKYACIHLSFHANFKDIPLSSQLLPKFSLGDRAEFRRFCKKDVPSPLRADQTNSPKLAVVLFPLLCRHHVHVPKAALPQSSPFA